jgi:hypothetical protein
MSRRLAEKLRPASEGIVFVAFAVAFASFALGAGEDNRESTRDLTLAMMQAPGGVVLLLAVGAAVSVVGGAYVIRGLRRSFAKYLRLPASDPARLAVNLLGVIGYVAKGIALLLVGLLIIIATLQVHPEQSTGLDGGLKALRDQPFGFYALSAVGLGLSCYGLFQVVRARLGKM